MKTEIIVTAAKLDGVWELVEHLVGHSRHGKLYDHIGVVAKRTKRLLLENSSGYFELLPVADSRTDLVYSILESLMRVKGMEAFRGLVNMLVRNEAPIYVIWAVGKGWIYRLSITAYMEYIVYLARVDIDNTEQLIMVKKAMFYLMLLEGTDEGIRAKEAIKLYD